MTHKELEDACAANGLRLETSWYDCGERISVYSGTRRVVSTSRDCADDESPVDVVVRYLTKNRYIPNLAE